MSGEPFEIIMSDYKPSPANAFYEPQEKGIIMIKKQNIYSKLSEFQSLYRKDVQHNSGHFIAALVAFPSKGGHSKMLKFLKTFDSFLWNLGAHVYKRTSRIPWNAFFDQFENVVQNKLAENVHVFLIDHF